MSNANNNNNEQEVLTPGQEGTTGNNRGLNESGEGMDRDLGNMDNGELGVPQSNPSSNPGSGRQSNGEGDGGSSSQSNAKGSSGNGGYGSIAVGTPGSGGDSVKGVAKNGQQILNTGGSSASEDGMGSGNRDEEGNANLANNSNIGNEQNAEKLGANKNEDNKKEGSGSDASGKDGAVTGNS